MTDHTRLTGTPDGSMRHVFSPRGTGNARSPMQQFRDLLGTYNGIGSHGPFSRDRVLGWLGDHGLGADPGAPAGGGVAGWTGAGATRAAADVAAGGGAATPALEGQGLIARMMYERAGYAPPPPPPPVPVIAPPAPPPGARPAPTQAPAPVPTPAPARADEAALDASVKADVARLRDLPPADRWRALGSALDGRAAAHQGEDAFSTVFRAVIGAGPLEQTAPVWHDIVDRTLAAAAAAATTTSHAAHGPVASAATGAAHATGYSFEEVLRLMERA